MIKSDLRQKTSGSILQQSRITMRLMDEIKGWKSLYSANSYATCTPERKQNWSNIHLQSANMDIVLSEMYHSGKTLLTPPAGGGVQRGRASMETYKKELEETFEEKVYLERFLVTEKKRMEYLTAGSRKKTQKAPFSRVWLELILSGFAKTSSVLRELSANELSHIEEQYLTSRQMDLWHQLQNVTAEHLSRAQINKNVLRRERFSATSNMLNRIWQMYIRSQFREAAREGVIALQMIEQWPDKRAKAVKWRFEADLCYLIGLCLDGLKRYRAALVFFQMDARLAEFANIMTAKKRALDNIGRMYAALGKYKEALACWTQRLKTNIEGEELAWLLYQIALCHTMMDDYKEAVRRCRSCIIAAESAECFNWALSGNLLLAAAAALIACQNAGDTRMIQTSMLSLEQAYNFALRINRGCVINAVLEIIRNVYNLVADGEDDNLVANCWSSSLLELLKQESTNRTQFNTKVLRELLLHSRKKESNVIATVS